MWQGICVRIIYAVYNLMLAACSALLFINVKKPASVKKIMVFRTGSLGDIACAIPSLKAIKAYFPDADITLLTNPGDRARPGAGELLTGCSFINKIIVYYPDQIHTVKKCIAMLRDLRKEKPDMFIELPQNRARLRAEIRNIIIARAIGCKYAFGFKIDTVRIFARAQSLYMKHACETDRLLAILKKAGISFDKSVFNFDIPENSIHETEKMLEGSRSSKAVAVSPGAKLSANIWPVENFAKVLSILVSKYDTDIFIIGGTREKEPAAYLKKIIGPKAYDLSGKITPLQAMAVISRSALLISNDTGTVHMASLTGTPVIGVYSAREIKGKWYPFGRKNIIIRKEPACHSCCLEACEHKACLHMISPEEVYRAAERFLK